MGSPHVGPLSVLSPLVHRGGRFNPALSTWKKKRRNMEKFVDAGKSKVKKKGKKYKEIWKRV